MTLPIMVRPFEPDDEDLIVHSWLTSYRQAKMWKRWHGHDLPYFQNRPLWWERYKHVIEHLMASSPIDVCCVRETPDIVCGWRVGDSSVLHYVLVKKSFGKFRSDILSAMLDGYASEQVTYTHELLEIPEWPTVPRNWTFDPLLAFARTPSQVRSSPNQTSPTETSVSTDARTALTSFATSVEVLQKSRLPGLSGK